MLSISYCLSAGAEDAPAPVLPGELSETSKQQPILTISFTTVYKGAPLGDRPAEPLYTVVNDISQWNKIRERLPARVVDAVKRGFQFNGNLLVIAFAGAKSSSGYSIKLNSIVQKDHFLLVEISQTSPAPNEIVEPAFTLPAHITAISKKSLIPTKFLTFVFHDAHGNVHKQVAVEFFKTCRLLPKEERSTK
jgi:hypothetical protein